MFLCRGNCFARLRKNSPPSTCFGSMLFGSHFTVGVTRRLLLSSRVSLLVIDLLTIRETDCYSNRGYYMAAWIRILSSRAESWRHQYPHTWTIKIASSLRAMKIWFFSKRKNPGISSVSIYNKTSNSWHYSCPRSVYCRSIVFLLVV